MRILYRVFVAMMVVVAMQIYWCLPCVDVLLKLVFKPTFFCCSSNVNDAKNGSLQFQSN
ncbi:MAG: hypothetical protein LBH59_04405 [Planctomycetaceae bacterium]|nr:hypothetical protein [Planctomycetaceae bacterium]